MTYKGYRCLDLLLVSQSENFSEATIKASALC